MHARRLFSVLPSFFSIILRFCLLFSGKFYICHCLPHTVVAAGLLDPAQLIGPDQLFEVVDLLPQDLALVGLLHEDAVVLRLEDVLLGEDVQILVHSLFGALEGLVGAQGHGAAGIDQRVARDAGLFVVGAAEAAVDDHEASAALDGALALLLLHGDMAVDDVAGAGQAKLRQNAAADGFLIIPCIIGVLYLGVGGSVFDIQPLEGGHGAAAIQGRELAAPQIPQEILSALAGGAALGGEVAPAGALVTVVHEGAARVGVALESLHSEGAFLSHRHSAVIEQVAVLDVVDTALGVQELDVLL
mgnify:FL=1